MAFAFTISGQRMAGNHRYKWGTFTNAAGDTGGPIGTGLRAIFSAGVRITSHLGATEPQVSDSAGTLTLVTDDGVDGEWWTEGL